MSKICTSLEQSKKLVEFGIDVNTADMFWADGERLAVWNNKEIGLDTSDVPAWSLTALLNILAKETHNIDEDGRIVLSSYKGNWWNVSTINCISEEIKESNSPLDAAFEMVCWILENKNL